MPSGIGLTSLEEEHLKWSGDLILHFDDRLGELKRMRQPVKHRMDQVGETVSKPQEGVRALGDSSAEAMAEIMAISSIACREGRKRVEACGLSPITPRAEPNMRFVAFCRSYSKGWGGSLSSLCVRMP